MDLTKEGLAGADTGSYKDPEGRICFVENGVDIRADTDPVLKAAVEWLEARDRLSRIFDYDTAADHYGKAQKEVYAAERALRAAVANSKRCQERKDEWLKE